MASSGHNRFSDDDVAGRTRWVRPRRIGVGSDEFKHVFSSTVVIFTFDRPLAYAFNLTVGRNFLIATFISGLMLLPIGRASCESGYSPPSRGRLPAEDTGDRAAGPTVMTSWSV